MRDFTRGRLERAVARQLAVALLGGSFERLRSSYFSQDAGGASIPLAWSMCSHSAR